MTDGSKEVVKVPSAAHSTAATRSSKRLRALRTSSAPTSRGLVRPLTTIRPSRSEMSVITARRARPMIFR